MSVQKQSKKGFTLIELLVVIAIIALLLAILMPGLKAAKKIAQGVVCINNTKTLAFGATLFANDNDDKIPKSAPTNIESESVEINRNGWVYRPHTDNDTSTSTPTLEDRTRGIEYGTLFPYVGDHGSYNCIGDRRFSDIHHNYLSYAMPDCIRPDSTDTTKYITKFSQISIPSEKYIFLEESDTRSYVVGGWSLGTEEKGMDGWWDGMAVWHNNGSTFGFADGHAEIHKWHDPETLERASRDLTGGGSYGYEPWKSPEPRTDLDWVQAHWPFAR